MLPEKRDLVSEGVARLKSQWTDKPVINGLLKSFLLEIQKLEDSTEFLKNLSINNSMGEDLDRIGRLWNVPRAGRGDEEYRAAILSFVSNIDPDISPEGIMEALRAYGQTDLVALHEHFPAFTQTYMGEGWIPDMYSVLLTLKPAGTGISLFVDDHGDSLTFIEEFVASRILVTHEGEGIVLDDSVSEKLWAVDTFATDSEESLFSEFAEEDDVDFHPMAEEINREVVPFYGNIVDDGLNQIVDDEGNQIIYSSLKFKV